jgi:hypothetical protein
MQIRVEIKDNGDIQLVCVCLKTDSWHDYLSFKADAVRAFRAKDIKAYARFLRAALLCMFAHTEAVVNEICDKFQPALKNQTLCNRISSIVKEAKKINDVPPLVFGLEKNLRDMIAHPGVEKSFDAPGTTDKVREDYGATYERLDYQALERFEAQISPWLDAVCAAFHVTRLEDTETALNQFTEELVRLAGGELNTNQMPEGGPM